MGGEMWMRTRYFWGGFRIVVIVNTNLSVWAASWSTIIVSLSLHVRYCDITRDSISVWGDVGREDVRTPERANRCVRKHAGPSL
jgi:hypothetical protein